MCILIDCAARLEQQVILLGQAHTSIIGSHFLIIPLYVGTEQMVMSDTNVAHFFMQRQNRITFDHVCEVQIS